MVVFAFDFLFHWLFIMHCIFMNTAVDAQNGKWVEEINCKMHGIHICMT